MKKVLLLIPLMLIIPAFLAAGYIWFGPAGNSDQVEVFVIPQNPDRFDPTLSLYEQKLIKSAEGFDFLLRNFGTKKDIQPGGYRLSQKMNAWQVMKKITGPADMKWVTLSFCPRKEQVGEKLAETLGWSQDEIEKWNSEYTNTKPEYFEGVYYPDTYLLPVDETGDLIAQRLIARFNEKFAPLAEEYVRKNIKWTTGLKIASLIAREAAGSEDMKLISGIIWNRLNTGMALQIDATMQYTLGKTESGSWWGNIDLQEKRRDSPYNSYLHKGLPPTPICSPNIEMIEAALNPEETDCLFYLHGSDKQIHCAETYEEHKENIEKYLK